MEKYLSHRPSTQKLKNNFSDWFKPIVLSGIILATGLSDKAPLAEENEKKGTSCEPKVTSLCVKSSDGVVGKQCAATWDFIDQVMFKGKRTNNEYLDNSNLWELGDKDYAKAEILENPNLKLDVCGIKNLLPILLYRHYSIPKNGNDKERYSKEEIFIIVMHKLSSQIVNPEDMEELMKYGEAEFSDAPYNSILDRFIGRLTVEQLSKFQYYVSENVFARLLKATSPTNGDEFARLFYFATQCADLGGRKTTVIKYEKNWKFTASPEIMAAMLVAIKGNVKMQEALLEGYTAEEGNLSISPDSLLSLLKAVQGNDGLQKALARIMVNVELNTLSLDTLDYDAEREFSNALEYADNRDLQKLIAEMYGINWREMPNGSLVFNGNASDGGAQAD